MNVKLTYQRKMLELIKEKALEAPYFVCFYLDVISFNKVVVIVLKTIILKKLLLLKIIRI